MFHQKVSFVTHLPLLVLLAAVSTWLVFGLYLSFMPLDIASSQAVDQPSISVNPAVAPAGTYVTVNWTNLPVVEITPSPSLMPPTNTPTTTPITPTPATDVIVTVTYPNGGETVQLGQPITITWTLSGTAPSPDQTVPTTLALSQESGGVRRNNAQISTTSQIGANSFTWTPPNNGTVPTGSNYRVLVALNQYFNGRAPSDVSDGFITVTTAQGFRLPSLVKEAHAQIAPSQFYFAIYKKEETDNSSYLYYPSYLNCSSTAPTTLPKNGNCQLFINGKFESDLYEIRLFSELPVRTSIPLTITDLTVIDSSPDLPGFSLHILEPNGDEQFYPGGPITIRWKLSYWNQNVQSPVGTVFTLQQSDRNIRWTVDDPDFSPDDPFTSKALFGVDTASILNTEHVYTGTLPLTVQPGTNYRIGMRTIDQNFQTPEGGFTNASDESDLTFSILPAGSVVSPTPTGSLNIGSSAPTLTPIIPTATNTPTPTLTPTITPTPTPIDLAPVITITNPKNGATIKRNSNVTIAATATDDRGVIKVEFYVNNVLRCTDTTRNYTCTWKTPNTRSIIYTLQARAYDTTGKTTNASITVAAQ